MRIAEDILTDGNHIDPLSVLCHAIVFGIQNTWHGLLLALLLGPRHRERWSEEVDVAVFFEQLTPFAEVGHVDLVDKGTHILLQQHLGSHNLDGILSKP